MKKILLILSIVLIGVFFVLGFNYYNGKFSNFQSKGYVIETESSNKYYFADNSKYKIYTFKDIVEFQNDKNDKKVIPNDAIIHYNDGSAAVFKKSALVDLSDMTQKSFQYYTIFEGTVLSKAGSDFKVDYLGKQLNFKEFILKTAPNKYMIASPSLSIKVSDEDEQKVKSGYIELTYFDGNIVKLQNQEIDISNISSEIFVYLDDDTVINLVNKKIYNNGKFKVNLGEITINSDDNIEIVPETTTKIPVKVPTKNETKTDTKTNTTKQDTTTDTGEDEDDDDDTTQKTNKVIHRPEFDLVADGEINAAEIEITRVVQDNAAIKDAEFSVEKFELTANSVYAKVNITDKESVLVGDLLIKIVKLSTNEVVYLYNDVSGSRSVEIDVATLMPDTNYALIMNMNYEKNNITYNRDFVQKTFVTPSLGITLEKEYVKTDGAKFVITKSDYSKVKSFKYSLYNNTTKSYIVEESEISFDDDKYSDEIVFEELKPNHELMIRVYDFVYGNTIINSSDKSYVQTFKTLKVKPILGGTSFSVDKRGSKFIIYLDDIADTYGGITAYRVNVYDTSNNQFILSKDGKPNSNIELLVDDEILKRNVTYIAYVYLVFNDNEKEYEIPVGSDFLVIDSYKYPTVTFRKNNITHESISGNILIREQNFDDTGTPIPTVDTTRSIMVTYQNLSVGAEPLVVTYNVGDYTVDSATGLITLTFGKNNLKKNDSYLFTVKAYIKPNPESTDVNDVVLSDIGQFIVNTIETNDLTSSYNNSTGASLQTFEVGVRVGSNNDTALFEMETMKSIKFMFYSENYDKTTACIPTNQCWWKRIDDSDPDDYHSSLKELLYSNDTNFFYTITQDFFSTGVPDDRKLTKDDITYGNYYFEVTDAYDYTDYQNEIVIHGNPILIKPNNMVANVINKNNPMDLFPILNETEHDGMNIGTQTGVRVTPNLTAPISLVNIQYFAYDASTSELVAQSDVINSPDGSVLPYTFEFATDRDDNSSNRLKRGRKYYFKYTMQYTLDGIAGLDTSDVSKTMLTKKQDISFESYLSYRTNDSITFKYFLNDLDGAIEASTLYYYNGSVAPSDINDLGKINLVNTGTNQGTFTLNFDPGYNSGALNAYINKRLNDYDTSGPNAGYSKIPVVAVTIGSPVDVFTPLKYTIEAGHNKHIIKFENFNDVSSINTISADIVIKSNGVVKKTLRNVDIEPRGSKSVTINYNDIKELKSTAGNQQVISFDIVLYYDNGQYGVDMPYSTNGYAMLKDDGSKYLYISDPENANKISYINELVNHNYNTKTLTFQSKNDNTLNSTINYSLVNGKFQNGDGDLFYIVGVDKSSADCKTGEVCTFSFDEIKPTIDIKKEDIGVTTYSIEGEVSGVDVEDEDTLVVTAQIYKCLSSAADDPTCNNKSTTPVKTENWDMSMFNVSINQITGLEFNQRYYIKYTWHSDNTPNGTFTSTAPGGNPYFIFTTKNDIGIHNVSSFYEGNLEQHTRKLYVSFDLDITEGFDGLKFIVYQTSAEHPVLVSDVSFDELEYYKMGNSYTYNIDIFQRLETGKNYLIDIVPYVGSSNLVRYEGLKFKFSIALPSISISRITDVSDNRFDIRVVFRDVYNALGNSEHSTYSVYKNSVSSANKIGDGDPTRVEVFNGIECVNANGICKIIVRFNADTKNTPNDSGYRYRNISRDLNIRTSIYIGNPIIINTSDNGIIRVGFTDSFELTRVNRVAYTIYDDEDVILKNNDNYSPSWVTLHSYTYFDLPSALDGSYTFEGGRVYQIVLQFYSDDVLVGNTQLNYSKG